MWIVTSNSFLSVVDKAPNPAQLVVRSRRPGHIEAIFQDAEVIRDASGDYLYRAFINREEVAAAMAKAVMDINYPNFKNSIKDDTHHSAANRIWGIMADTQEVPPYSGNRYTPLIQGYGRGKRVKGSK